MRGLQLDSEFDQPMMDLAGGVSGARFWEEAVRQVAQEDCLRRRGQDFLSASGEPGQVVALCLSQTPTHPHSKSPKILKDPAQLPLSLGQL